MALHTVFRWRSFTCSGVLCLGMGLGLTATPGVAGARDNWQAALTLASDYVLRGRSQTDGEPALQASASYQFSAGTQLGLWASSTTPALGPELDLLLNHSEPLGDALIWNLGLGYYGYPGTARGADTDRIEAAATLAWLDRFTLLLSWSPSTTSYTDQGPQRGPASSVETTWQWPLRPWLVMVAGVGLRDLSGVDAYRYWNLGVGASHGNLLLELSRIGTDTTARTSFGQAEAGDRTVISLTLRFGGTAPSRRR